MFEREHASFIYFKEGIEQKQKNQPRIYLFLHFLLKLALFLACDFAEKPQKRAFPRESTKYPALS